MGTITLEIPEAQIVGWVRRLSPESKRKLLTALLPDLDRWEAAMGYGDQRVREICAQRGLDWDRLTEQEREQLVDTLLHEE